MKKNLKRLICLSLTLIMLMGCMLLPASAKDKSTDAVAKMWFCSMSRVGAGTGHIFVAFENLTDDAITVGSYTLEAGEIVTVGCFGEDGSRGYGVYYNLEVELDFFDSLRAVSVSLDPQELMTVNRKLNDYNYNHWGIFKNCYYFASKIWNAGPGGAIPYLIFPGLARFFVLLKGGSVEPFEVVGADRPVVKHSELV